MLNQRYRFSALPDDIHRNERKGWMFLLTIISLLFLSMPTTGRAQTSANVFTVDDFIKVAQLENKVEDIHKDLAFTWLIASESYPRPLTITHYCTHRLMGVALPVFKDLHLISTLLEVSTKLNGPEDQRIFNEMVTDRMRHVLGDLNDDIGYKLRIGNTTYRCRDDKGIQTTGAELQRAISEARELLTELADRAK